MSKYSGSMYLKKTKARVNHTCSKCGKEIKEGGFYFKETMQDRFLQNLHANKFCIDCYEQVKERSTNREPKSK